MSRSLGTDLDGWNYTLRLSYQFNTCLRGDSSAPVTLLNFFYHYITVFPALSTEHCSSDIYMARRQ
jgi:hypothetical protein